MSAGSFSVEWIDAGREPRCASNLEYPGVTMTRDEAFRVLNYVSERFVTKECRAEAVRILSELRDQTLGEMLTLIRERGRISVYH